MLPKGGGKNDGVNEKECDPKPNSKMNYEMIIEILNDTILHGQPLASTSKHTLQYNTDLNVENITFKHIISKYRLDSNRELLLKLCHVHLY